MNSKILFLQLLIIGVTGQSIDEATGTSPVPDYIAQGASVGLAEPTSVWEEALKTTSPEFQIATATVDANVQDATPSALNLLMNNAAEGDLHGASPRNNMVYFGIGRHGVGFGSENCGGESNCNHHQSKEGCSSCGHHHEAPCAPAQQHAPQSVKHHRHVDYSNSGPCDAYGQPYLKVTPSVVVKSFTRTHVETCTSTSYDVSTHWSTRTFTDEHRSTKTHILNPEHTRTYVERHTVYEYPASTINANHIHKAPVPTNHGCASDRQKKDSGCDC